MEAQSRTHPEFGMMSAVDDNPHGIYIGQHPKIGEYIFNYSC